MRKNAYTYTVHTLHKVWVAEVIVVRESVRLSSCELYSLYEYNNSTLFTSVYNKSVNIEVKECNTQGIHTHIHRQ